MVSNIIKQEKVRQEEILIGCPNMCEDHKHEHLEHKRVLINLKEYMESQLERLTGLYGDFAYFTHLAGENIKELTKMIEIYTKENESETKCTNCGGKWNLKLGVCEKCEGRDE